VSTTCADRAADILLLLLFLLLLLLLLLLLVVVLLLLQTRDRTGPSSLVLLHPSGLESECHLRRLVGLVIVLRPQTPKHIRAAVTLY
jgi:hypothetical protein